MPVYKIVIDLDVEIIGPMSAVKVRRALGDQFGPETLHETLDGVEYRIESSQVILEGIVEDDLRAGGSGG